MLKMTDQMTWEEPACGICGSNDFEQIFQGPDRLERLPGQFQFVRCPQCGVFRQSPRLAWKSLIHYYPDSYTGYYFPDKPSRLRDRIKARIIDYGPQKRLRAIEKYLPKGKMLEVGCGSGGFLKQAIQSGHWEASAVEPNPAAAAYVQKTLGVPVFHGQFSQAPFEPEEFDAIVMWCVLEHLSDPLEDLAQACKLLKPKGWLFFSVPHYESLEARFFKEYWAGWDLPRHLYVFPRPQLKSMLKTIGFRVVDEKCISMSYDILRHSIAFWSQTWEARHPGLQQLLLKIYGSTLGKAAMVIPLGILDRLTLTSTLTVFAQKE
jgi:SAM-dependent methyltransferase